MRTQGERMQLPDIHVVPAPSKRYGPTPNVSPSCITCAGSDARLCPRKRAHGRPPAPGQSSNQTGASRNQGLRRGSRATQRVRLHPNVSASCITYAGSHPRLGAPREPSQRPPTLHPNLEPPTFAEWQTADVAWFPGYPCVVWVPQRQVSCARCAGSHPDVGGRCASR